MIRGCVLIGWLVTSWSALEAAVYAPRVTVAGEADPYSIETWTHDPAWKGLSDADFAMKLFAIWNEQLALSERSPRETNDPVPEFAAVADPVKLRHVYGYGSPRTVAAALAATWQASGRGRGRLLERVESQEWWVELESAGRWWVFNVSQREAFPLPTGGFMTIDDVRTTHDMQPATYRRYEYPAPTGHTLDLVLRRGERFTQFFGPQGKRWRLLADEGKDAQLRKLLAAEPVGPKAVRSTERPLFANGEFVYEPNLKADAADFTDGVLAAGNVTITADGLTLENAGEGYAIFEMASPYVIVPELGKLEDPKDDRQASVVEIDAAKVTLAYSPDEGATWLTVDAKEFPAKLDLSAQVSGLYGYLLRMELKGKPGEAVVKSLKITTSVQLASTALPAVQSGTNRFQLRTGDAFGEQTRAVVMTANTADENSFLRPVIWPPREYKPGDKTSRVIGPFTLRLGTPYGAKVAWFTVGGTFANDSKDPMVASPRIGYATGKPQGFTALELPTLSSQHDGANYHLDRRVQLDEPASTVYLQVEGQPALNELRATAHVLPDRPRDATPLIITHRWSEAGAMEEHTHTAAANAVYQFNAGTDVVNHAVEYRIEGTPH